MKAQSTGPALTTIFVDYDNIYLSLKRKSDEAARRFAKDSALWLREIESGRLITPTSGIDFGGPRRIAMNRCYGNPVPRRNSNDNSTDMNSFPFVRHHFLRAGFEVIDCPPLTAQLKNSADIRMVMDVRDVLTHDTYFDEFIILSGDADFTPVLHRLRAHARRSIVFANDHTAAPYTAISDGEVREADLIALLLEGAIATSGESRATLQPAAGSAAELEAMRREIVAEVVQSVRQAARPVPLEALADRAVRTLGHERTVASGWGGAGSFRDLLVKALPADVRLSEQPPFVVFDTSRQIAADPRPQPAMPAPAPRAETSERRPTLREPQRLEAPPAAQEPALRDRADLGREARAELPPPRDPRSEIPVPRYDRPFPKAPAAAAPPAPYAPPAYAPPSADAPPPSRLQQQYAPPPAPPRQRDLSAYAPQAPAARPEPRPEPAPAAASAPPQSRGPDQQTQLQQSIARIHEACQAPPLSPPEYRLLFEVMAEEINANNLAGAQTLVNIGQRARDHGIELRRDDVRFVLEVVSEADPWFEQGASAALFASRFRNFVVGRCRAQGLTLSADELDLIEAWFGGGPARGQQQAPGAAPAGRAAPPAGALEAPQRGDRWGYEEPNASGNGPGYDEEFPRIIRRGSR